MHFSNCKYAIDNSKALWACFVLEVVLPVIYVQVLAIILYGSQEIRTVLERREQAIELNYIYTPTTVQCIQLVFSFCKTWSVKYHFYIFKMMSLCSEWNLKNTIFKLSTEITSFSRKIANKRTGCFCFFSEITAGEFFQVLVSHQTLESCQFSLLFFRITIKAQSIIADKTFSSGLIYMLFFVFVFL